MKSNFKLGLLAIMMVISAAPLLQSCKKIETSTEDQISQYKPAVASNLASMISVSEEGHLIFTSEKHLNDVLETLNTYTEDELNEWETNLGFTSLRTSRINQESFEDFNTSFEDDLFATIVDKNGIIQIGNIIFKAETDYDLVWTLDINDYASYDELLSRTFVSSSMNIFRPSLENESEDDIWEVLVTDVKGIDQSDGQFNSPRFPSQPKDKITISHGAYVADVKAAYQGAVFYKSLMTELKYRAGGFAKKTDIRFYTYWGIPNVYNQTGTYAEFTPNKRSKQYKSAPSNSVYDNKRTWRPYASTRKLNSYKLKGEYLYYCLDHSSSEDVEVFVEKL